MTGKKERTLEALNGLPALREKVAEKVATIFACPHSVRMLMELFPTTTFVVFPALTPGYNYIHFKDGSYQCYKHEEVADKFVVAKA